MNLIPTNPVGCIAVNDHISQPIPEVLWHYTSFAGFQGIISSRKIWATEYRFLNDQEEFCHAKRLVIEMCEDEPEFGAARFPVRDMIREAIKGVFDSGPLNEDRIRIMVASFSEAGDLLSQWRGYSGNSTGVSLGLDLRGLRPPLGLGSGVTFAPCVYNTDHKRSLIRSVFAHFCSRLEPWWKQSVDSATAPGKKTQESEQNNLAANMDVLGKALRLAHSELQLNLVRVAPLLKNESFSEEKEWRLVLPSEIIQLPTQHPIEFRANRNSLVPYVAFPLLQPNQEGEILLRDVILGPGCHTAAAVGVNLFLSTRHIPIPIRVSKIPYRPS
jgi:hypothetical protein